MSYEAWVAGGRRIALGDEHVWYRVDGDGPTLLFAHGYPTSSHDFAPIIAVLAKTYRCVSFDFLGFGASAKPKRDYDYALQHQVLARVTADADVRRAVFVVHDYAVTLGQDFLAGTPRAPFALDGVIFMNGGVDPAQHRARVIQRFLTTRFGRVVGPRIMGRKAVMRSLSAIFARKECLPADDAWAAMSSDDGIAVLPRLLHYMAERRRRRDALIAALASVTPRAFIWGIDDPVSGGHMLEAIRPHAAGALFRELPGVGHYPQLEAPEEVASFIAETASAWLS